MSKLMSPTAWAVIVAVVGTVAVISVTERTRIDVRRSIDGVMHTLDVQRAFNVVLKGVLDAETGQRGFLLARDPAYLAPFKQADAAMAGHLATLGGLTSSDRHHQSRVRELAPLVAAKMRELRDTIDLATHGQHDEAITRVRTNEGQELTRRIRALLDSAFVDEQRVARQEQAALDRAILWRAVVTDSMAGVLVVALVVVYLLHARVRRLAPLVTLCAWTRTIKHGDEWISVEEFLERRFGVRVSHGLSPAELRRLQMAFPADAPAAGRVSE